jgi:PAS domain S-box-containing protein
MKTPLRILIVEDSEDDALLVIRQLKIGGYDIISERVDSSETMANALIERTWDIVLSDFTMPHFNGIDALEILKGAGIDIPFIIISGTIGEETAVEVMRAGAHDYIMKNNMTRLLPAVERELREAKNRSERRRLEVKKKLAEDALRESEERYRSLVELSPEPIVVHCKGKLVYVNPALIKLMGGIALNEFLGRNILDFVHPDYKEIVINRVRQAYENNIPGERIEEKLIRLDGVVLDVEITSVPLNYMNEPSTLLIITDITYRKQTENALIQSEKRYRRITEGLTDYLYTVKVDNGKVVETLNGEACHAVTGYTSEEFTSDPFLWFSIIVKEDQDKVTEQFRKIQSGENIKPIEHRIIRKDRQLRWVRDTTVLFKDESGILVSYDGVIKDITERKLAEFALRTSEERFSKVFQLSPIAIAIFRVSDGCIVNVNDEFVKETGYAYEEIIGHTTIELQLYANPNERNIILKTLQSKGILENYEFKTRDKFGRIGISLNTTIEITLGEEKHYLALIQDITVRKQVENELRKLSRAVEQSPATIVITDINRNIEYVNPKFTEITGYTKEEAIGQNPRILKSGEMSPENYTQLWKTITSGKEWRGEFHNKKKNGELYWEFASISPIFDNAGNITHFVAVKEDITEKKEAERNILNAIIVTEETERNKFAQELHDGLGPMISTVKLYFQWLSETNNPEKRESITKTGIQNIDDAIQAVRDISNKLSPRLLNNMGLLPAICYLTKRLNETQKISIVIHCDNEIRYNTLTEATLYRILSELINNTLKHAKARKISIEIIHDLINKNMYITYCDDGIGFNIEEVLITRKGMGIFNMKQRIETLKGTISFDTYLGKSLSVKIELPITNIK